MRGGVFGSGVDGGGDYALVWWNCVPSIGLHKG
jgi:hypothetical protein